jgi:hypothetical protein
MGNGPNEAPESSANFFFGTEQATNLKELYLGSLCKVQVQNSRQTLGFDL